MLKFIGAVTSLSKFCYQSLMEKRVEFQYVSLLSIVLLCKDFNA
jgi:hypothetical protein